ncbi:MAG: DUF2306 domain-containing protein [Gammaproteobacteria bacterium]|nr:DUF2306 domain-containing protein [Gammaproteobacteria bacterium]
MSNPHKDAGFLQLESVPATAPTQGGAQPAQLRRATTALNGAAGFWYLVTASGQLMFVAYLLAFYGGATLRGDLAAWNRVVPHAFVPGDTLGNGAMGLHVLLAAVIMSGGLLQLIPGLRQRAPGLHRWSGRFYLAGACAASLAGLYMVWFRAGETGDLVQHLGITGDAVLILLCAGMALRHALARDFRAHRRWALRLFMAVSAVWFFRIGLMAWLLVNQGPAGFDPETFRGPFLSFLSFADYLLPLAVLELYFLARERTGAWGKAAMAAGLIVLTLVMGLGVFGAGMALWLPRIQ